MGKKNVFAKISPFQVDPEKVLTTFNIQDDDFNPATDSEKESVVARRKSVSFWKDAARRFKANTISMVALVIFIMVLVFAFVGPYFIPYSYGDQYRSAFDVKPFQYSEKEQIVKSVEKQFDVFHATAMQRGSLTAIDVGNYYFKYNGKTIAFTISEVYENSILGYKASENKLIIVKNADIENGVIKASKEIEILDSKASDAQEMSMVTMLFPHIFGTDSAGRDLLARTMFGARVSISVGIIAALIVLIIGSIYGAISGLFGGVVDFVMMRLVELIYSIPEMLVVLLLQVVLTDPLREWINTSKSPLASAAGALGAGVVSIFITFALLYWVTMARIIRGQVLQIKKQEFVTAANALGASNARIIRRHLLPNCVGPLVITTCLQIPSAIFLESFLSFLGVGVSAPMASLGSLCSDALATVSLYPYRLLIPTVVLILIVLSLNLIGDGLRDALDPRLKK